MKSPHAASWQVLVQSSDGTVLPSSHPSVTVFLWLSPQVFAVQSLSHAAVSAEEWCASPPAPLPGSHDSTNAPAVVSSRPSPQNAFLHRAVQSLLSPLLPGPRSHCSASVPALSVSESPHLAIWQCAVQSLVSASPPDTSHCSVLPPVPGTTNCVSSLPSPHDAVVQSALHVAGVAPGSQVSPTPMWPSPHVLSVQSLSHPDASALACDWSAPAPVFGSHCS